MTGLLYALIPVLLIGYTIFRLVRCGFEMKQLAERGIATTARIIDRQQFATARGTRRNDRYLRYEYTDDRGVKHTHRSHVTSSDWLAVAEGDSIPILYLPDKPAVSAPRDVVEKAREALRR
jgi:hypothetical protein